MGRRGRRECRIQNKELRRQNGFYFSILHSLFCIRHSCALGGRYSTVVTQPSTLVTQPSTLDTREVVPYTRWAERCSPSS